jgi:hypothetical protein
VLCSLAFNAGRGSVRSMRDLLILAIHLVVTFAKLLRPGGIRAVAAESLVLKHQLMISNRARKRAPNLTSLDRCVLGITTLFVNPRRISKLGAIIKSATLHRFHRALVDRKYRLLFSSASRRRKPGPPGRPEEFHLQSPTDPYLNLSIHTARASQDLAASRPQGATEHPTLLPVARLA